MSIINKAEATSNFSLKKFSRNFAFLCQLKTRDTAPSVSEQMSSKKRKTKCNKAEWA
jgi:hypothetical protein